MPNGFHYCKANEIQEATTGWRAVLFCDSILNNTYIQLGPKVWGHIENMWYAHVNFEIMSNVGDSETNKTQKVMIY